MTKQTTFTYLLCRYDEMLTITLLGTILSICIYLLEAQRPNFRLDYRYEKAFSSFYKLHQTAITWPEASLRCQAEGSQLLVPAFLDEADAVPLLMTIIHNKFDGIFVGIHDLYSERLFITINGATVMDSILNLLWEYKQPQHSGGRCVAMRRTGRIFVHRCNKPLPFICKMETSAVVFNEACKSFNQKWKLGPNDTCYFLHEEPQNWYQAFGTCLSAGGHLAIVNSHDEANYIRQMYKSVGPRRMPLNDIAFLGFNDLFQRHHFRTVQGERVEDLRYRDWEKKCPETYNSTSNLRCGGIRRSGLLTVGNCDVPALFFCEKLIENTTSLLRNSEPLPEPKVEGNEDLWMR